MTLYDDWFSLTGNEPYPWQADIRVGEKARVIGPSNPLYARRSAP